jgi:hypothetical protein
MFRFAWIIGEDMAVVSEIIFLQVVTRRLIDSVMQWERHCFRTELLVSLLPHDFWQIT